MRLLSVRVLLAIAAWLVLAAPTKATTATAKTAAQRYRIEDALTLRTYSDLTWSADGQRLAFVVASVDTAENTSDQDVWLYDHATRRTTQLTRHPKADFSPTFSPSGDTIAFVATRGSGDAKPAIYMMSLSGGDPWAFGTYDESIGQVAWSPDGRWLAYVKVDTLAKRVAEWRKKKWDQVVEDQILQFPSLWVVEIATGKQRRLTTEPQVLWYVRWSPDSRSLAFLTRPTGRPDDENLTDIGVVPVQGGAERKLGVIGSAFTWSPDGKWIALATALDRTKYLQKGDLWIVPASGGNPINLTAGYDGDATTPAWSPHSDTLFFQAASGVGAGLAAVPRKGGRVTLLASRNDPAAPSVASNGRAAWIDSSPLTPAEVFVADHAAAQGHAVTTLNAAVAQRTLATTRAVSWLSSDRVRVEGLLLRPHGAPASGPLKTIVVLHGGPYGDRNSLAFQTTAQILAAAGFQVFMPNFRSSGGYGTEFMMRQRADWGGQDWRDVTSGIDSLVKLKLADPNRLGVMGRSYGGYLSAWAITQTGRFDAACVMHGAVDLPALFGQSDIAKYRAFEFGGYPWVTREAWEKSSPMTYIQNVHTPTLIMIGDDDRRIPYPQAQQLYQALRSLAVPCEFVHYPREGHVVREYRHRWDQASRMVAWFDRWVR
jgi:dipeptidyl aminopeptidase/acylaminoacyl peptidase